MIKFITNRENSISLNERLKSVIKNSNELKFLVGFFYFSGWQDLCKSIEKNDNLSIRMLVGLEVDRYLSNIFEFEVEDNSLSVDEHFFSFMKSLGMAINSSEMDNKEFYEQVDFFVNLLEKGKLIIRKTLEPNHAKLYLFKWNDKHKKDTLETGRFITGSSNLTKSGLHRQNEFNVEISDYGFEEAESYFDELWVTAIPISEAPNGKSIIKDFFKNKSISTLITPFEAYAYVLKTYLDLQKSKDRTKSIEPLLEDAGFTNYAYQVDAVNFALDRIEKCNGVIISDVVGLGKSVIASLVAKLLNKRGLILCPPGLIGEKLENTGWWEYLNKFRLYNWDIESVGKIEELAEKLSKNDLGYEVVVVDEAHRFRNQDTSVYQALSEICRNKEVMLLTATPFNNTPADIFSLLKLFLIPGKSPLTLEDNLEEKFRSYNSRFKELSLVQKNFNSLDENKKGKAKDIYKKMFSDELPIDINIVKSEVRKIATDIKVTISPVVIRRNRIDLQEDHTYRNEIKNLSKVTDPKEQFYQLSKEQLKFYDKILEDYFGENGKFHGAIYKPDEYERAEVTNNTKLSKEDNRSNLQQKNLFHFMRRILVKRFESSFGAFKQSIDRFLNTHKIVLSFIEYSGVYFLDRKIINSIYNDEDGTDDFTQQQILQAIEDFEQAPNENRSPKHSKVYKMDKMKRKDDFIEHIKSDIKMFEEISREIDELDLVNNDPKRESIIISISKVLNSKNKPKRKVIVFTEYTDTVSHLKDYFSEKLNNRVLICDGTVTRSLASEINNNFNASAENKTDKYDVLVTSDKLSEGVNLNRAGLIINYDIPWNPTRVIQRVGRINRIGKKVFNELHIYNFFPTKRGANHVRSREIAEQKMFLIHNALGEDAKIFNVDEEPTASGMYSKLNTNPEKNEQISFDTECRNEYDLITKDHPEVVERLKELPNRTKTAKLFSEDNTVIFKKKGVAIFAVKAEYKENKIVSEQINFVEVLPLIKCEFGTKRENLSSTFWDCYDELRKFKPNATDRLGPLSYQQSALNSLNSILKSKEVELNQDEISFIYTLINDIKIYKTIPHSTLRDLTLNDKNKKPYLALKDKIIALRDRLGDKYLDSIIERSSKLPDEVIIAIENIKGKP